MTTTRVPRSMQLYDRSGELIPGSTQLISRRPSRFAYCVSPVYAQQASGARFTDVDGHEYIDWGSGIGSIILGYADPVVEQAVQAQLSHGVVYSINHELELELAEYLVKTIPCAEMVRYAKGGGEACAIAVRIARGATGRDKILFSGYHGWHDWYLAANLGSGVDPLADAGAGGHRARRRPLRAAPEPHGAAAAGKPAVAGGDAPRLSLIHI